MDWTAVIFIVVPAFVRLGLVCVRGSLLRRTLRTALQEMRADMTVIEVEITDRKGPSAAVRARVRPAETDDHGDSRLAA